MQALTLLLAQGWPLGVDAQGHFADVLCQRLHELHGSFLESLEEKEGAKLNNE